MIDIHTLPGVTMKRIICHWTAGNYNASDFDKQFYHFLIDGTGSIVPGKHSIADNVSTADGNYAAHTLHCNTGSIGVSCCAMGDAVQTPFKAGAWPLKLTQLDVLYQLVAELADFYKIPVTPRTVLTHAEVQANLGIIQRGKWDISFDPFKGYIGPKAFGDNLRSRVFALMATK